MWEQAKPDRTDLLRQGDLIVGVPFPKRGTVLLLGTGLSGSVRPNRKAVVLDQCCTVENRLTVLLGLVGSTAPLAEGHQFLRALRSDDASAGSVYAYYEHLLSPHQALPTKTDSHPIIMLLERLSLAFKELSGMRELQDQRVARMTPLGRAQLRAKLAAHFANPEAEDGRWLQANGYDMMGRSSTEAPHS